MFHGRGPAGLKIRRQFDWSKSIFQDIVVQIMPACRLVTIALMIEWGMWEKWW